MAESRRLSMWRTLRFSLRAAWDALGLVCAISLTFFLCGLAGTLIGLAPGRWVHLTAPFSLILASIVVYLFLLAPLYAGACCAAHSLLAREETAYIELWRGFASCYRAAVALGAIQLLVTLTIAANLLFYLSRGSFIFFLLAALFFYLLLFWLMNCLYHGPLLAAGAMGIMKSKARVGSVLRNGFLLALSAPGFTFVLLLVIIVLGILAAFTGVGMALVFPGFAAILSTQAARDQLVRYGALPPPVDLDAPVDDPGWRVR